MVGVLFFVKEKAWMEFFMDIVCIFVSVSKIEEWMLYRREFVISPFLWRFF